MANAKTFGSFFNKKRRALGKTLREFCRINGLNAGNISKLERDLLSPPQSKEKLTKYADALGIKKGANDWFDFFDLAATAAGKIPSDIASDAELMGALPILFRSIRNKDLEEEELHDLIKSIRKELR